MGWVGRIAVPVRKLKHWWRSAKGGESLYINFMSRRSAVRMIVLFFFFQAEDGIRDYKVTGVQPCALPISPHSCTRRQGQLALLMLGLLDAAEAAIAAMPEGSDKRAAQIEYEADTWERHNPFLSALWAQLGGTSESLDAAFLLAVTL